MPTTRHTRPVLRLASVALTALVALAAPTHAQLPNASASTLGLAGNNTAAVRGFAAISVNPAGLGMPGSGFSLALVPTQVRLGLSPVGLGDVAAFQGQVIPQQTKEEWLTRVIDAGGQQGTVGADATAFALTLGNVGFQVSTVGSASVNLPPGLIEAGLFGNAGRTGSPTDLSLLGGFIESFAVTTAGMSLALPVNSSFVFGFTGKYTYGHALAIGRAEGGSIEADPIRATMDFPVVTSCQDELGCTQDYVQGGAGFGMDLGAMLDLGGLTLGASIQNIVNTFAWDETKLGYRAGTISFDDGEYSSDYDELPFDQAPDDLRALVTEFTFKPTYRLGAALDVNPMLTLTGDIHGRLADQGMALMPGYHTGVGAELNLGFVHLRGGLAKVSEAMQYGAGTTLVLGPVNLSFAGGLRKGALEETALWQLGLSFGNR